MQCHRNFRRFVVQHIIGNRIQADGCIEIAQCILYFGISEKGLNLIINRTGRFENALGIAAAVLDRDIFGDIFRGVGNFHINLIVFNRRGITRPGHINLTDNQIGHSLAAQIVQLADFGIAHVFHYRHADLLRLF